MTELAWARPWGLASLVLPPLLLWLARLAQRPPERATGTLALWREVAAESATHGRSRPRIPLRIWLFALALAVGGVALAGPHRRAPERTRTWTVLVDLSPSTGLELAPGVTRRERALDEARAWLRARLEPGDELRWAVAAADGEPGSGATARLELRRSSPADLAPPPELLETAARGAEPAWARFDRPGWLWVTDRAPGFAPEHASVLASGGAARPGPVGTRGPDRVDWDGARLVLVPGAAPARCVEVEGLPEVLRRLVAAWAAERGLAVRAADQLAAGAVVLRVRGRAPSRADGAAGAEGGDGAREVRAGRDGWSLRGLALPLDPLDPAAGGEPAGTWLADEAGTPLVRVGPGRVDCAWSELDPPAGDPAAFAVAWSELFDRCVLPAPGTMPLRERLAAGQPFAREGEPPPRIPRADAPAGTPLPPRRGAPALDAWLALTAALIALAGLVYSGSDSSSSTSP